jgi:hypothetical protein
MQEEPQHRCSRLGQRPLLWQPRQGFDDSRAPPPPFSFCLNSRVAWVATSGGGGVERALGFRGLAFIGKRGHGGADSGE